MAQVPDKDNIRNSKEFNGLDWTDGNRMHKNAKRLGQTLPDEVRTKTTKEKIAIKCSKCNRRFKTVNGILPKHEEFFFWPTRTLGFDRKICEGGTAIKVTKEVKPKKVTQVEIKGIIYKVGDKVLVEKRASTGQLPTNVIPKRIVIEAIIERFSTISTGIYMHFKTSEFDKHDKPIYHSTNVAEFTERGLDILKIE